MRRLAAALTLSFTACAGSRDYAESRRILVDVGMTHDEVRRAVGEPERKIRVATSSAAADQTTEVWECEIEAPPNVGHFAALVLAAGALVLVAAGGGGGTIRGGPDFPRYRFWVGFGPDGRVRGVTNLEGAK